MKKGGFYIALFLVAVAIIAAPFTVNGGFNVMSKAVENEEGQENAVQNYEIVEKGEKTKKNEDFAGYYDGFDKTSDYGAITRYFAVFDKKSQDKRTDAAGRASIDFLYGGKTYKYFDEIIDAPDHLIAETIFNRKINAPLADKLRLSERCLGAGATYKDALSYTFPLLYKTVDALKLDVDCAPVDSTIKFEPEARPMFTISKEKNGFELIEERLYQEIYYSLRRNAQVKITVIPKILHPSVTALDNIRATSLRSRFSTDYSCSIDERKHNIKLALSKINGAVLMPGEEFSFNKTVGRRTERNGFKTAKIIVKGEYVDGLGGGVCQASTTLYNGAIRADLEITQVRSHSLTSSYVPASFDAMVNSGSSDLKFKNNSLSPVFIRAFGTESYAQVEFYGAALPYRISTESVIISKTDAPPDSEVVDTAYKYVTPDAIPGSKLRVQYSHGGVKSEGYLIYTNFAGKVIEKRLIRKDSYNPCSGIIAIAPGAAAEPGIQSDNPYSSAESP